MSGRPKKGYIQVPDTRLIQARRYDSTGATGTAGCRDENAGLTFTGDVYTDFILFRQNEDGHGLIPRMVTGIMGYISVTDGTLNANHQMNTLLWRVNWSSSAGTFYVAQNNQHLYMQRWAWIVRRYRGNGVAKELYYVDPENPTSIILLPHDPNAALAQDTPQGTRWTGATGLYYGSRESNQDDGNSTRSSLACHAHYEEDMDPGQALELIQTPFDQWPEAKIHSTFTPGGVIERSGLALSTTSYTPSGKPAHPLGEKGPYLPALPIEIHVDEWRKPTTVEPSPIIEAPLELIVPSGYSHWFNDGIGTEWHVGDGSGSHFGTTDIIYGCLVKSVDIYNGSWRRIMMFDGNLGRGVTLLWNSSSQLYTDSWAGSGYRSLTCLRQWNDDEWCMAFHVNSPTNGVNEVWEAGLYEELAEAAYSGTPNTNSGANSALNGYLRLGGFGHGSDAQRYLNGRMAWAGAWEYSAEILAELPAIADRIRGLGGYPAYDWVNDARREDCLGYYTFEDQTPHDWSLYKMTDYVVGGFDAGSDPSPFPIGPNPESMKGSTPPPLRFGERTQERSSGIMVVSR